MFASRVGGSSRPGPLVRSGFTGEGEARRRLKSRCRRRGHDGKFSPRLRYRLREPRPQRRKSRLSPRSPPHSVPACLDQGPLRSQRLKLPHCNRRRSSGGGRTAGPCPPVTEHKPTQERRAQPRSRDVATQTGQTSLRER